MPLPRGMDMLDYLHQMKGIGGGATKPTTTGPTMSPWEGPFKHFQENFQAAADTEKTSAQHKKLTQEIMNNLGGIIEPGGEEAWWKWAAERAWAMLLGRPWPEETMPGGGRAGGVIDARTTPEESPLDREKRRQAWYSAASAPVFPPGGGDS